MKPRLALTMGDINGVGPEILVKALAHAEVFDVCEPVVVGSIEVLAADRGADTGRTFRVVGDVGEHVPDGVIPVLNFGLTAPEWRPGQLDAAAGRCAVEWIRGAIRLALAREVDGIVTCPINKEGIHRAGYRYAGHTEILAEMTSSRDYCMSLFAGRMRIVHVSSHCSLAEAIDQVKTDRIATCIRVAHEALRLLAFPKPRIAVAALNPHAGEAGLFGDEEAREIEPAVRRCRAEGIECSGPHPPDTVFRRMMVGDEFDLTVAMYHDQGHIPLKLVAMDEGVNVTLGLPIVRTSVDHGTAYDIAGKNLARENSLCRAIELAAQFARAPRVGN